MDHGHMDHSGMDHGDMDHGHGGGMKDMCSMNVCCPQLQLELFLSTRIYTDMMLDALHLEYQQPLHRLPPMACPLNNIPLLLPRRRRSPRCRLRSPPLPLPPPRRSAR